MTYFSHKEKQTSTELLQVSSEKLCVITSFFAASSLHHLVIEDHQLLFLSLLFRMTLLDLKSCGICICYKHLLYGSCSELGLLFQDMFPDRS